MKCEEHNCRQCKNERFGRCYAFLFYGKDVSMTDEICPMFIDDRSPEKVTFKTLTLGQIENYLKEYFYIRDFYNDFTRPQLREILEKLYPFQANKNKRAFSNMCKKRMVKHIKFYIELHNLKCNESQ